MDVLLSAVVSDLFGRSASFVINRYFQRQPGIDMILQRLERVVLRIDTVVEEAEGRHITNQGMLRQLKMLRQGMYRGHYVLDALTFQAPDDEEEEEEEVSHSSSALTNVTPAKRLRFSQAGSSTSNREELLFGVNSNVREELQRMVDTLEDTMAGMKEFLFFLQSCPPILRQPYGAYLLLDNCMFGRQSERQRVLDFLLRPSAAPDLAVLPIVGPIRVGKTTLVEHICRDESVRDRFSMILFFPEGSLKDEGVIDLDAEDGEGGGHGAGGLPEERGGQGGDVGDATATEMGPSPRSRKKAAD
uniref:Disease resistance N-terminal domain-containing protein n=1 Tax=Aegilops tauschii subsp. strangulata TaxID=200361 RepID=A0A452ZNQ1_AEGTS